MANVTLFSLSTSNISAQPAQQLCQLAGAEHGNADTESSEHILEAGDWRPVRVPRDSELGGPLKIFDLTSLPLLLHFHPAPLLLLSSSMPRSVPACDESALTAVR